MVKTIDRVQPIAWFKLDARNARRHSQRQIEMIAGSIRKFGFVTKLIVRPEGELIGGEATLEAARLAGMEKVPCTIVEGLSEPQYRALALALNKLPEGSTWDAMRLSETVRELLTEGEDPKLIGFSDRELKALVTDPEPLDVKEIDTGMVVDEFWISLRGPLAQQARVFKAMEEAVAACPGVVVEIGTIGI